MTISSFTTLEVVSLYPISRIGGVDFDVLDITVQMGITTITQKYYVRVMKGYVLSYIVTYQSWDELEELDNCLETVRFI